MTLSKLEKGEKNLVFRPQPNKAKFKWEIGMEFSSLIQFKDVLIDHALEDDKCVNFKENGKIRVKTMCTDLGCNWLIYCSKI